MDLRLCTLRLKGVAGLRTGLFSGQNEGLLRQNQISVVSVTSQKLHICSC